MSIFRDLLAIKRFREGQAELAVARERNALAEARLAREQAEALLQQMLADGVVQEQRLYRELCDRVVRLRDIEDVQLSVVALRAREAQQLAAAEAAVRQQQQAADRLENARDLHQLASRQTSKFVDLARNHAQFQLQEAERKEDMEMEEAASVQREREEWSEPEETA